MLRGPSSLSECFLTRKMDYTGNSISNKISIHLKEFQDFYWEYLAAVFPPWFTAARFVQAVSAMLVLLCELPQSRKPGAWRPNLQGQISDKSHPVKLEKWTAFLQQTQRKPRAVRRAVPRPRHQRSATGASREPGTGSTTRLRVTV